MESGKVVAVVQGRMSSSRLPGKILKDIAGKPMLAWVVDRARLAQSVDEVIFATTTDPSDDPVAEVCAARGIRCFRGDLYDVLDRFYQAARQAGAGIVVRLTADCPLVDPGLIDATVAALEGHDFAANRLPPPWHRTYPIGLDVEACTFAALERAWREAGQPYQREHVMPYLYDSEGRFRVRVIDHEQDYGDLRWTVDTPADLELVRAIVSRFGGRQDFSWLEVLDLFQREPELARINAGVQHKSAFDVDDRGLRS